MEENKFAAPYVSPEVIEQLGLRSGKTAALGMVGLPSPDFDAYKAAAEQLVGQAEQELVENVAKGEEPKKPTPMNRKQRRAAAKKYLKDKRKQQSGDAEPQTQYVCDPSKNVHCKKTHCHLNGGPCKHTTKLEYAKQPVETARMVIPVNGKERTELMKQYAEELKDL